MTDRGQRALDRGSGKVAGKVAGKVWIVDREARSARLRTHNQNRTVAARAIADMKTFGHLS